MKHDERDDENADLDLDVTMADTPAVRGFIRDASRLIAAAIECCDCDNGGEHEPECIDAVYATLARMQDEIAPVVRNAIERWHTRIEIRRLKAQLGQDARSTPIAIECDSCEATIVTNDPDRVLSYTCGACMQKENDLHGEGHRTGSAERARKGDA